jgi:C-terminal processing protease CtpA/Prc
MEGGVLIVWSPDDGQAFPTGFGADDLLFTADDPVAPIPAGYNLVSLDAEPFTFWKEPRPELTLFEGSTAVNDFSDMSYAAAFEALFEKVSREYPFTVEKGIDWDALYAEIAPLMADARNDQDFYRAMRQFALQIPDAHVGLTFDAQVFFDDAGGSFGMRLAELSDGRVVVVEVLPDLPAEAAGITAGSEIVEWEGAPVQDALDAVVSLLGPYSTPQHERLDQLIFLTRYPPGTRVSLSFQQPGESVLQEVELTAEVDYDSLFASIPAFQADELALPVEAQILDSGLGYIRINSFVDDLRLEAYLWERFIDQLIELGVPGLIIDVRVNGGGSGGLAADFAGYFFEEEIEVSRRSYYNDLSGAFEFGPGVARIRPAPLFYGGEVAVLVSPHCVSACEGFANMLSQQGRAAIIGHFATAGAYGEVGQGQYDLPGGYSMQFPTGRPETLDGELLIEGTGVPLDITVPVTLESALEQLDAVLDAAIAYLLDRVN